MKNTLGRILLPLAVTLTFLYPSGGPVDDLSRSIPKAFGPWQAAGEDRVYGRNDLYEYMDGGAEVYLAFDLRQVWARKYAAPGDRELSLDVFDMGSSEEAYGVLSCDREDPGAGIGQDSTYGFGLLRFRQGRYFVTVMTAEDDKEAEKAVLDIGRAVAKALGPPGPVPDLLGLLPREALRAERTSFFHANVSLSNRYFVASENILGLDRDTDCVFAEYGTASDKPAGLLIVRYPDMERAEAARRAFLSSYLPEAGPEGTAQTENKKWVSAARRGRHLVLVFDSPGPEWTGRLVAAVPWPLK